jgi:hypothetical protein
MSWTGPKDLLGQVQKRWDSGALLAEMIEASGLFPLRLQLKGPSSAELGARFEAARDWSSDLRGLPHYSVVMREFKHRQLGANALPAEVWLDSLDAALALLSQQRAAARFRLLVEQTAQAQPLLLPWLARRPLAALNLGPQWPLLLAVVAWLQAHPRPAIYLRQLDLPGVHSKFIEAQRGVLAELLDLALPPDAIDAAASGSSQFNRRYGFLDKPLRVRLRPLDQPLARRLGGQDLTLDSASFAALDLRLDSELRAVFITENEINFLSFPPLAGGVVIFGGGYGFEMLAESAWLQRSRVYYWGDIDTHGFAILDQLRARLPAAESFLMDRSTLLAHANLWGAEATPTQRELTRLTPAELALYDDLRRDALGQRLRLEQERIGFGWLQAALRGLNSQGPAQVG